jgi:hypothetical protein
MASSLHQGAGDSVPMTLKLPVLPFVKYLKTFAKLKRPAKQSEESGDGIWSYAQPILAVVKLLAFNQ